MIDFEHRIRVVTDDYSQPCITVCNVDVVPEGFRSFCDTNTSKVQLSTLILILNILLKIQLVHGTLDTLLQKIYVILGTTMSTLVLTLKNIYEHIAVGSKISDHPIFPHVNTQLSVE